MNGPHGNRRHRPHLGAARHLAPLLAAAFLAACGGPPPASLSLQPAATTVDLVRGQTLELIVEVSHSGSSGIELEVSGAPTGVSAAFDEGSMPAGGGQATLLISVAADAPEGSATLSLSATSGSLSDSAEVGLQVAGLALSGRITQLAGLGLADVVVSSQGQTVTTTANGAFELSGLSVPYDLTLYYDDGADGLVHVYQGMSSDSPTLTPFFAIDVAPPVTPREATVAGEVLGGAALPATHRVVLCAEGRGLVVYGCTSVDAPDNGYLLELAWLGPEDSSVRIHAIRVRTGAGGQVIGYQGYLTRDIVLSDGDSRTLDLDVSSSLDIGSLGIEVAMESGSMVVGGLVLVQVSPNLAIPLGQATGLAMEFLVPSGSGLGYAVVLETDQGILWRTGFDLEGGEISVPLPPAPLSPLDGATGVGPATLFHAFVPDGRTVTHFWSPNTVGPVVALSTLGSDPVTLPDLSDTPAAFPAGATYGWRLFSGLLPQGEAHNIPGYGDFLAFLYVLNSNLGGPGPDGDGDMLISVSRSFVLAP